MGQNTSDQWASAGEVLPHIIWPCNIRTSKLGCQSMVSHCYVRADSLCVQVEQHAT